jgi:hypothetical protein
MAGAPTNRDLWAALLADSESYDYRIEVVFLDLAKHSSALKKCAIPRDRIRAPIWYCSHEHTAEEGPWCEETPDSGFGEFGAPYNEGEYRSMDVATWYVLGPWNDITKEEVEFWRRQSNLTLDAIFNRIASQLAIGFSERRLPFVFCDAVINDLNGLLFTTFLSEFADVLPEPFYEIYLAFDAGEYYREDRNIDPVETYTRPLVAKIVAKLSTNS